MRIINGKFKGRRFSPPTNITARPTTDFAKESLFNVITNNYFDLEDTTALDLFSGTGSISFEFVSRGCSNVTAIEMSEKHLAFIKKTSSELKISNLRTSRIDVFRFLKSCSQKYDIIFADPPYQLDSLKTLPDLIFEHSLLTEDGLFVLEHGSSNSFSEHP
ncbi:MAG: RsmD family RNA methyltransferase, partial [Paludibacteraceae bacterium]|nr:RsmD family RNA methyltransferase [Paludibacteraceae bacterium]